MKLYRMTAALLALTAGFGVCTLVLAEPPPYFSWYGSPWTKTWTISRTLNGGSGIRYKIEIPKKRNLCNGGGIDSYGRSQSFCGWSLENPSDLDYTYEIREFSGDGTLVRVTGCTAFEKCWVCQGVSKTGSQESFEMKTPHACGEGVQP